MDGGLGPLGRPKDVVRIGDIALDELDADLAQRNGFVRIADQSPNAVAALDQLHADVGSGLASCSGHEDGARHGGRPSLIYYISDIRRKKRNTLTGICSSVISCLSILQ